MIVGIVSDSRDAADAMQAAAELLRFCGASLILHCGDVGGRHVLDQRAGLDIIFVWGDRDRDRMGLLRYAQRVEIQCCGVLGDIELADKRVALVHGDDNAVTQRLLDEQRFDYVFCGHTLKAFDTQVGRTRLINPGGLTGATERTAALLNLQSGELTFLTVNV